MSDLKKILETAKQAAFNAGEIIKTKRPREVSMKSKADFVTEVDIAAEKAIISKINNVYPKHNILSEETGEKKHFEPMDDLWIIDPLDGTTNFIHNLRHSAVSIAYYTKGDIKVGLIYNPYLREMFYAVKGEGAFLNNMKITVSAGVPFSNAIFATGFPFRHKQKFHYYKEAFSEVLLNSSGVRRFGSAALDLAYVACGRYEAFFEGWLSPWDVAAGALIVEEAGGIVSDFKKKNDYLYHGCIIASSKSVYGELQQICEKHLGRRMDV